MIRHNKVLSTRIRASWNRIWKLVTGCNCLQEFENPLDPKTLESGFGDQILWFRKDGRPILKKTYIFAGCKNILICVDRAHSRGILWPIPHLLFLLEFAFHLDETKELAHRKTHLFESALHCCCCCYFYDPTDLGSFSRCRPSQKTQRNQTVGFSCGLHCLVVLFLLLYVICALQREPRFANPSPCRWLKPDIFQFN